MYGSQSSVISELFDDLLAFPASLLSAENYELRLTALGAIDQTDKGVFALTTLARNLASARGAGDVDGFGDRTRESAYSLLDAHFRRWLSSLRVDEPATKALGRWHKPAREIIRREAERLLIDAGPAAWQGRNSGGRHVDSGQAEVWFRKALNTALPYAFEDTRQEQTT